MWFRLIKNGITVWSKFLIKPKFSCNAFYKNIEVKSLYKLFDFKSIQSSVKLKISIQIYKFKLTCSYKKKILAAKIAQKSIDIVMQSATRVFPFFRFTVKYQKKIEHLEKMPFRNVMIFRSMTFLRNVMTFVIDICYSQP